MTHRNSKPLHEDPCVGNLVDLAEFARVRWWTGTERHDLHVHEIQADADGYWRPGRDPDSGEWHIGLEWQEPRDVQCVVVRYVEPGGVPAHLRVQYWRKNWPTPAPERRPGAGRGWIGQDDPWHGQWTTVRAEKVVGGACTFTFDPLDLPELGWETAVQLDVLIRVLDVLIRVVTLRTQARSFSFLVTDLERGPLYIQDYGVFITWAEEPADFTAFQAHLAAAPRSIYERVPDEPEQSLARAMAEIPPLDVTKQESYGGLGRYVVLGVEAGRQEFALRYNGELFVDKLHLKLMGRDAARLCWPGHQLRFRFASGDPPDFHERRDDTRQSVLDGWLPVVTTRWLDREIEYTQKAFAALLNGPLTGPEVRRGDEDVVAMLRFAIRNTTHNPKRARLWLAIAPQEQVALQGGLDVLIRGCTHPRRRARAGRACRAGGPPVAPGTVRRALPALRGGHRRPWNAGGCRLRRRARRLARDSHGGRLRRGPGRRRVPHDHAGRPVRQPDL